MPEITFDLAKPYVYGREVQIVEFHAGHKVTVEFTDTKQQITVRYDEVYYE